MQPHGYGVLGDPEHRSNLSMGELLQGKHQHLPGPDAKGVDRPKQLCSLLGVDHCVFGGRTGVARFDVRKLELAPPPHVRHSAVVRDAEHVRLHRALATKPRQCLNKGKCDLLRKIVALSPWGRISTDRALKAPFELAQHVGNGGHTFCIVCAGTTTLHGGGARRSAWEISPADPGGGHPSIIAIASDGTRGSPRSARLDSNDRVVQVHRVRRDPGCRTR